jgi:NAD(P)-dependent dehydrogenase (short-subunit alcohol dehydrogenase family)
VKTLAGRVAVVTGAGSGIGRATSVLLARRGCDVALVDVDERGLAATARLVHDAGRRSSTHLADVSDPARMRRLPDEVVDRHGACHVLVNNAGVTTAGRFEDDTLDDLHWIVDINVWGVVHGCRFFLPVLRRADEAHIVNLSSMVAFVGLPQTAAYSLTKGAVRSFTEALRSELVGSGIGVTSVHPGAIRTNLMSGARGAESARLAAMARSRFAPLVLRPPETVAGKIVRAIERNRARAVVGPDAVALDLASRVLPGRSGLVGRLTNRISRRR